MSELVLDIGNTRSKIAVFKEGVLVELKYVERIEREMLTEICDGDTITHTIASVVGEMPNFGEILPTSIRDSFVLMSSTVRTPLRIAYRTPHTLGMDRIAAANGAYAESPGEALIIIDAGSCITVDFVDPKGAFHGGAILPGLNMQFRALSEHTAGLPLIVLDERAFDKSYITEEGLPIGNSTQTSIEIGVIVATRYALQGFIKTYRNKYQNIKVYLTGGDAFYFENQLNFPTFASPYLVLYGMHSILNYNIEHHHI